MDETLEVQPKQVVFDNGKVRIEVSVPRDVRSLKDLQWEDIKVTPNPWVLIRERMNYNEELTRRVREVAKQVQTDWPDETVLQFLKEYVEEKYKDKLGEIVTTELGTTSQWEDFPVALRYAYVEYTVWDDELKTYVNRCVVALAEHYNADVRSGMHPDTIEVYEGHSEDFADWKRDMEWYSERINGYIREDEESIEEITNTSLSVLNLDLSTLDTIKRAVLKLIEENNLVRKVQEVLELVENDKLKEEIYRILRKVEFERVPEEVARALYTYLYNEITEEEDIAGWSFSLRYSSTLSYDLVEVVYCFVNDAEDSVIVAVLEKISTKEYNPNWFLVLKGNWSDYWDVLEEYREKVHYIEEKEIERIEY